VTCPGAAPVPVSLSGSCATAFAALGGLIPISSCASGTQGSCVF
jgi:hypothetical protein